MKIKIISAIVMILFLISCSKENEKSEYFAFGEAYGMCYGDCARFFLIKNDRLYPDDIMYLTSYSLNFKSEALPNEKYISARKLIENFPYYLTQNPNKSYGCPDCADQGGIHIEIYENKQLIRWHFSARISDLTELPSDVQEYVQEIKNVIREIN